MGARRKPVTTVAHTVVGAVAMVAGALDRISTEGGAEPSREAPAGVAIAADALFGAAKAIDAGIMGGAAAVEAAAGPAMDALPRALPQPVRASLRLAIERSVENGQAEIAHSQAKLADFVAMAIDEVLQHVLESPAMEEATQRAIASPTAQRAVESALLGPLISRVLTHQGGDLARGVAEGVMSRTPGADLAADRLARLALWLQLTDREDEEKGRKEIEKGRKEIEKERKEIEKERKGTEGK